MPTKPETTSGGFHPAAATVFFAVLAAGAVISPTPPPLLAFAGAALAAVAARPGGPRLVRGIGLAFAPLIVFVTFVNIILAPAGPTLLFAIPEGLPLLGGHPITLETVSFALVMALRLIAILAVFLAWDRIVDTDRHFLYLARRLPATALTVLLAVRLLPVMRRDFDAICEAHRVRGLPFDGGLAQRWGSYAVVLRGLLILSLERGLDLAEAMHARGFASGPRSCAVRYAWRPRDTLLAGGGVVLLLGGAVGGWSVTALSFNWPAAGFGLAIAGALTLPCWEWGCRLRPYWRHVA